MLSKPFSTLEDPIGKSLARQLAGKDSEVWFATLRCGVLLAGLVCLMAVTHVGSHPDRWLWSLRLTAGLFLLGAIGILVAFARLPKRRRYHLLVCVLLDIGSTGCLAFFIDYWAVPFYFLGLCLVMAYGFRYGNGIMLVALAVFALDFGTSALMQPRGMDGVPVGFLLLACMAFTAVFVQSHHVRLTRTHTHLQSEIDAHAEFIGVFGDELKTSVDALLGESRENPGKTRVPDLPQHARETVSCLLRPLPDDILDYCAVKRGTFALTTQDFNLFESVQRTLCTLRRHAPDRQKRISLQVEPTLSFALHGDERRLGRTMLHVLCDTLGGCDAGHFVVRLTGEIGSAGQVILREGIIRASSACSSPANQNASPGRDRALPLRSASLAGHMAGHLASALGGELVRRPLTERRLVELAVPLGTQGARVRQGALHGMEALAIGFEEGSLMRLCTQLERWSAVTLSAVDLPSAREVLSGARRTNRQLSLILLHADALRSGSDGSDSGPDFARHVADATVLLRSWCEPCVSIVLSIQGQVRSSLAGLLDAAPELLSVLESPIQPEQLFNVASAAHAIWATEAASADASANGPFATALSATTQSVTPQSVTPHSVTPMPPRHAANASLMAPGFATRGETEFPGMLWPSRTLSPPPTRPVNGQGTYRILLAEGSATNAMVVRKILERGGHYCELVDDGIVALDRLTSEQFDAAVLDENLAIMNGYELAKAYRYIAQPDETAAIILCTAGPNSSAEACCEAGVVAAFVSLPISAPDLLGTLDRIISRAMGATPYRLPAAENKRDAHILQLVTEDAPELDHEVLEELEEISPDPAFLDKLLNGFVHDNRAMLDRLHRAVQADRNEEARQLLHAIKGSAVSVGAVALKDLCCHLETLALQKLLTDGDPMVARLDAAFHRLCNALESWRAQRQLRVPR